MKIRTNKNSWKLICLLAAILCTACKVTHKTQTAKTEVPINTGVDAASAQPVIVYKTKGDYARLVPVLLSDDKSVIVAYPGPADINPSMLPIQLINGYMIDNKGIFPNVAFLKLTYDDYAKLKEVPSLDKLYKLIIDKDPLLELCDCGKRNSFTDISNQLIQLIKDDNLKSKCKKLK